MRSRKGTSKTSTEVYIRLRCRVIQSSQARDPFTAWLGIERGIQGAVVGLNDTYLGRHPRPQDPWRGLAWLGESPGDGRTERGRGRRRERERDAISDVCTVWMLLEEEEVKMSASMTIDLRRIPEGEEVSLHRQRGRGS